MKKETYCLACRTFTKSINPKIVRQTKQVNDTIKLCSMW